MGLFLSFFAIRHFVDFIVRKQDFEARV